MTAQTERLGCSRQQCQLMPREIPEHRFDRVRHVAIVHPRSGASLILRAGVAAMLNVQPVETRRSVRAARRCAIVETPRVGHALGHVISEHLWA